LLHSEPESRMEREEVGHHWEWWRLLGIQLLSDGQHIYTLRRSCSYSWDFLPSSWGYFVVWNLTTHEAERVLSCLSTAERMQHPFQFDSAPNPLFCWMCQTQTIGVFAETARKPRRR
jgi:hypothetical protein